MACSRGVLLEGVGKVCAGERPWLSLGDCGAWQRRSWQLVWVKQHVEGAALPAACTSQAPCWLRLSSLKLLIHEGQQSAGRGWLEGAVACPLPLSCPVASKDTLTQNRSQQSVAIAGDHAGGDADQAHRPPADPVRQPCTAGMR